MTNKSAMINQSDYQNPFTLSFGKVPNISFVRTQQIQEVQETFCSINPVTNAYVILGVRGSGKTVLLTQVQKVFNEFDDFIVIELNPQTDMLENFASSLYEQTRSRFQVFKREFSFSFSGIGITLKGEKEISSIIVLLEDMLEKIKNKNKKVLICIDEIENNNNVKVFMQQFQIFLRRDYPIFLIMTGLFENVRSLQNEKSLTFLYRLPFIQLPALNLIDIADVFERKLSVKHEVAVKMSKLTQGYAFACQVLGYIFFAHKYNDITEDGLEEFDRILCDFVYEKLYFDLPKKEKEMVYAIATSHDNSSSEVIEIANISRASYSQLRERLIKKGILASNTERGKLFFAIPRFEVYVLAQHEFED